MGSLSENVKSTNAELTIVNANHKEHAYQFHKASYFYVDKIEDILAYFKRLLSYDLNSNLADMWSFITEDISSATGIPISKVTKILNDFMERLFINLPVFSFFFSALQIAFLLYKNIYFTFFSREDKVTRGIQFVAGGIAIVLVTLGILTASGLFTAASPILFLIGSIRGVLEHTSIGITNVANRFLTKTACNDENRIQALKQNLINDNGTKQDLIEYTKLLNAQADNNCRILNRINATSLSTTFLIGSTMLLTPLAPVGFIVIKVGTAIALADAIFGSITGKNTTRWIADSVNFACGLLLGRKPFNFTVRTEKQIWLDLAVQTKKRITIKPDNEKQEAPQASNTLEKEKSSTPIPIAKVTTRQDEDSTNSIIKTLSLSSPQKSYNFTPSIKETPDETPEEISLPSSPHEPLCSPNVPTNDTTITNNKNDVDLKERETILLYNNPRLACE